MMKTLQIYDKNYPPLLKQIYNPPEKLNFKGEISYLNKPCVSVVGTRKFSEYGKMMTEKIIEELSILDIAIVSGLAKGIDTIAHKSALRKNLPTIAVIGSGFNNIYPKENISLAKQIEKNGLILSEYDDNEPPKKTNFPQRNRIISGLSIATIVVECPEKSGALITGKLALDQNREIFTIPGDIDRENSLGPLKLIQKSGAYPISSGFEIIEILSRQPHLFDLDAIKKIPLNKAAKPTLPIKHLNLSDDEKEIFKLFSTRQKKSLDDILDQTSFTTSKTLSILSLLEIKNLIETKDGKFARKC